MPDLDILQAGSGVRRPWLGICDSSHTGCQGLERESHSNFFVKYFFLLLDWVFLFMSAFVLNKC